jgi:hypothetical protein
MLRFALLALSLSLALPLLAQETKPLTDTTREGMEWANLWWENAPDKTLPRVLLIGDSITNGYHRNVANLLKGKANVDLLATSANILDPQFMALVKIAVGDYKYSVIHFNNGLHGFQLSETQYEAGLRQLVALLKQLAPDARLIWCQNTPIVDAQDVTKLAGGNEVVVRRNGVAMRVMQELSIPIDDLYPLMADRPEYRTTGDGYHYNAQGKTVQADSVARAVTEMMNAK